MPIVNGKYKNPGWVNQARPAINMQNLNDISNTLEKLDAGGGGKRYASVVVGTSTNGWTAADCDYLCDGTDDQVEINSALQGLSHFYPDSQSEIYGGEVILLPGLYSISAPVSVPAFCTLRGCGMGASILSPAANFAGGSSAVRLYGTIRDLALNESGGHSSSLFQYVEVIGGLRGEEVILNVCFSGFSGLNSILVTGAYATVTGCYFNGIATYLTVSGTDSKKPTVFFYGNIILNNGSLNITKALVQITNNTSAVGYGPTVTLTDLSPHSIISQNNLESLSLTGTQGVLIANNVFWFDSAGPAITLSSTTQKNFVTGNEVSYSKPTEVPNPIADNGTGNIVRWNSNDTEGGGNSTLVTLPASGWSNKQQTVTVAGVSANEAEQLITLTPAISSQSAYYDAGIRATGQAANSVTFTADTVPTSDLSVYVVIQGVV